jgi:hypothetical protein
VNALMNLLPVATESDPIRVGASGMGLWPAPNATGVVTYTPVPRTPDRFSDYELYDVDDWDGYGALPISRETVESARRFSLQIPRRFDYGDIAPGSDGTIGFEWRFGSGLNLSFVLIDVGPEDIVCARKIDPGGKITSFSTRVGIGADSLISQLFQYPFL